MTMFARAMRYGPIVLLVHGAMLLGLSAATPAPPPKLVWAFGDSLIAGYGLPPALGFTARLQSALWRGGVAVVVRNGGVAGDTTAQGRARLLWGLRGLKAKPDLVIVELGANDMLRGLPPAQTAANLDAILAELTRRDIRVLLTGMRAAPNLGQAYRRRFEAIYPGLARRYRVAYDPFFVDGVAGNRALLQRDGLHPNPAGVRHMVVRLVPIVRTALAIPSPRGQSSLLR